MAAGINWASDMQSGEAQINSAISTASQGTGIAAAGAGAMRGDAATMRDYAGSMLADAASMRGQARLVNTQGNAVNQSADALAALVPKLDPYAQKLGGYGDQLAALGSYLTEQANDVFGQGGALVNLDPTKGGLSKEFIDMYGYLSPERYVSRAASDVQAAFNNAAGQMERQLARRGVSAGSGASAALRQQLSRDLAVALASGKTNARQQGINEQKGFLGDMTKAAETLYNMGNQTQSQATAALGAAGDAQKGAAGVVQAQGGLIGDAGRLRAEAGQLFANAASVFGSAAGVVGSAANVVGNAASVEGNAANLSLSALKNLQEAQQAAAQYYLGVGAQGTRTGGGGGGGFTSSKSADGGGEPEATGAWVDLTHGKASHADGAQWVFDPNAPAAPAVE